MAVNTFVICCKILLIVSINIYSLYHKSNISKKKHNNEYLKDVLEEDNPLFALLSFNLTLFKKEKKRSFGNLILAFFFLLLDPLWLNKKADSVNKLSEILSKL